MHFYFCRPYIVKQETKHHSQENKNGVTEHLISVVYIILFVCHLTNGMLKLPEQCNHALCSD